MKADSISSPSRKKTIRAVVIGIIAVIVGVYCFREQLELCALNSTCNTLLSNQNTIAEEKLESHTFPLIEELSNKWKAEHGLVIGGVGSGGTYGWNLLNVSYNKEDTLENNEARALLIHCASELLDKINQHKKLRLRMQTYPFTAKNLRFGISFGKGLEHPPKGKLAYISLYEDNINYFTNNPETGLYGRFELLFEETYEEAFNIISQSDTLPVGLAPTIPQPHL